MTKALICALALLAASSAHAVSVTLGVDWANLQIERIDLDPGDGIAPLHDTSRLFEFSRAVGPGSIGPADFENLSPYGARYFTSGAGALYAVDFELATFETTLSPNTAAVFSVAAFASASFVSGEVANASALLRASFDGEGTVVDGLHAGSGDSPSSASRMLSVRIDNLSADTRDITYGFSTSVFIDSRDVSPIPEPETLALLALALPLVAAAARRRRRAGGDDSSPSVARF